MSILTMPKKILLVAKSLFQKNGETFSMPNLELENMKKSNSPYHKELEKIIVNLCNNLTNIKQFYENKTQNEYQDDLNDLEILSKNLRSLFEYKMNGFKYRYSLNEKIYDAKIITEGLDALIQDKPPYKDVNCDIIVRNAKNHSNKRLSEMFNLFSIHDIPSYLQNDLSVLIIGHARSGKSVLLNELIKIDHNSYLLNQDKSTFCELSKVNYQKDIDAFERACSENRNIYIDDVHHDLKEELIEKYFNQNENKFKNKIVAVYQGLEDIKDESLIKKFDVIIVTRSSSLMKYKEQFKEEDFERLSFLSDWVPFRGYYYSTFNIEKDN